MIYVVMPIEKTETGVTGDEILELLNDGLRNVTNELQQLNQEMSDPPDSLEDIVLIVRVLCSDELGNIPHKEHYFSWLGWSLVSWLLCTFRWEQLRKKSIHELPAINCARPPIFAFAHPCLSVDDLSLPQSLQELLIQDVALDQSDEVEERVLNLSKEIFPDCSYDLLNNTGTILKSAIVRIDEKCTQFVASALRSSYTLFLREQQKEKNWRIKLFFSAKPIADYIVFSLLEAEEHREMSAIHRSKVERRLRGLAQKHTGCLISVLHHHTDPPVQNRSTFGLPIWGEEETQVEQDTICVGVDQFLTVWRLNPERPIASPEFPNSRNPRIGLRGAGDR